MRKAMLTDKQVYQIAEDAHRGQYRDNGDPYIVHPVRVAEIAVRLAKLNNIDPDFVYQVAILHDVLEDTAETEDSLLGKGISEGVLGYLWYLNKKHWKSYAAMLEGIALTDVATIVKYADLTDNLSDDTNPPSYYKTAKWKQRKDKYEIAKMYLKLYRRHLNFGD
jgi:guanosine-3',5'-bis(diphosphate) 3'-pyrophosphohydrolase